MMANVQEKVKSIKDGNLNSRLIYLITCVLDTSNSQN
jgi:hypothetical protein